MDDDGSRTVLLQGWTSGGSGYFIRDYNEMILYPVPDRVMYVDGAQQHLLWGKPLDGGVEILPRLAGLLRSACACCRFRFRIGLVFPSQTEKRLDRQTTLLHPRLLPRRSFSDEGVPYRQRLYGA